MVSLLVYLAMQWLLILVVVGPAAGRTAPLKLRHAAGLLKLVVKGLYEQVMLPPVGIHAQAVPMLLLDS
jgi:hypothetical protein